MVKQSILRKTSQFFILYLFVLSSCVGTFPPDKIDPAGNMTRADYLALRHRGPQNDDEMEEAEDDRPSSEVPSLPKQIASASAPPAPVVEKEQRVSLSVTQDVSVRDVLLQLGRQAKANLEIDPRITGGVIFTAHDQPFDVILNRLCELAGLRYQKKDGFIRIELDEPYQASYPIDYPSLARRTVSEVGIATNVFDQNIGGDSSSRGTDNNSTSKISAVGESDFWAELLKTLPQIMETAERTKLSSTMGETRKERSSFSIDKQAGLVSILGTDKQHQAVQAYLKKLQAKASAQVLIEARIVEVELNDEFSSGINWRTVFEKGPNLAARFGTVGAGGPFIAATTASDGLFTASLSENDFSGILSLVRSFGTTRILSSPRLTVLNNQTAVLKVARNEVYFVTTAQFSTTTNTTGTVVSSSPVFSSTPHTVPVGLVMTVQPAIDNAGRKITMTLRPTISRVVDHVSDPSIGLNAAQSGKTTTAASLIPVLAVREMDSVLQLNSGEVAVLGGLMQDSSLNEDVGIPPLDTLPFVGNLAKSRSNNGTTNELVILLRATIMDTPAPDKADVQLYQRYNSDPRPLPLQ